MSSITDRPIPPHRPAGPEERYLRRDPDGRVVETPEELFRRVARGVAAAEARYGGAEAVARQAAAFHEALPSLKFLPNTPTLMNAGLPRGQLAACFVIPVHDDMRTILEGVRDMALIHQTGGGTGFTFTHLRPRGDQVRSTGRVASGPVGFMRIFDTTTEVVKQGGRRRGANMGILNVDHPDILEFITGQGAIRGCSPTSTSPWRSPTTSWSGWQQMTTYPLINPRTGQEVGRLRAREVFDLICRYALKTGDPGLIFLDAIERANPTPEIGRLEATNPCGEQPLLAYESCNLGSINLARLVNRGRPGLGRNWTAWWTWGSPSWTTSSTRATTPCPRSPPSPTPTARSAWGSWAWRTCSSSWGSPTIPRRPWSWARTIMARIQARAVAQSEALAEERGPFPNFPRSRWHQEGQPPRRNATVTTVAPTGTISIIAGASSGIEPLFAVAYRRRALEGRGVRRGPPPVPGKTAGGRSEGRGMGAPGPGHRPGAAA